MFRIVFYTRENGNCPIEDFLEGLSDKLAAKAVRDIDILSEYGNTLREPWSKHLGNGVYELRIQYAGDAARIFYFSLLREK